MSEKTKAPASELYEQALKNYEQTLRTGLKLQEEASSMWTNVLAQAGATADWQKKVSAATNEFIPPTQKRMEEYLALLEENNRSNVELLKKALAAGQATSDMPEKWADFVSATLGALQSNAQAVTQIQSKVIDSWVSFVKKSVVEFPEAKAGKA